MKIGGINTLCTLSTKLSIVSLYLNSFWHKYLKLRLKVKAKSNTQCFWHLGIKKWLEKYLVLRGHMLPTATCNCWVSYWNGYLELLAAHKLYLVYRQHYESLAHGWNFTSLNVFHRYYFDRCFPGLAELVFLL